MPAQRMAQPNSRVNRASGPNTSSSDSLNTSVQVGAANTSSRITGDAADTNGRRVTAVSTSGMTVTSGAASTIGSARETSSAWVESNSTWPESSWTRITVLGDGTL